MISYENDKTKQKGKQTLNLTNDYKYSCVSKMSRVLQEKKKGFLPASMCMSIHLHVKLLFHAENCLHLAIFNQTGSGYDQPSSTAA